MSEDTTVPMPEEIDPWIVGRFNMIFDKSMKGRLALVPGFFKGKPIVHLLLVAVDPHDGEDLMFPIAMMYDIKDMGRIGDFMGNKPGSEGDKNDPTN